MFYLYIDESGDDGDYRPSQPQRKGGSSRFFTLGGIIVDNFNRERFLDVHQRIISKWFEGIQVPGNFVLHYYELREARPPFDNFSREERFAIANEVFNAIIKIDCALLSVTIDLDKHCKRYSKPVNVRAYALLIMLERFQYFLERHGHNGEAIYEEFSSRLQKKAEIAQKWLATRPTFPTPTTRDNVAKQVKHGDPLKEPMLQFADFFAYAPYIKCASNNKKTSRLDSVHHKYFNISGAWFKRGLVEIV